MANLGSIGKNAVKSAKNIVKKPFDIEGHFDDANTLISDAFTPDNSALEAALAEQNKTLPIADEEELRKSRRRKSVKGRGRSATILSQGENQGLGG
jgi:hypothetical protein